MVKAISKGPPLNLSTEISLFYVVLLSGKSLHWILDQLKDNQE